MLRVFQKDLLDPDGFITGAVVSPFKYTEEESFAQYAKLCRKAAAGAQFIITQLGYDVRKFIELHKMRHMLGIDLPVLGSVYLLSPKAARAMNRGVVPGAVVSDRLFKKVIKEWKNPKQGLETAVDRTAKLIAILKGIGYRGVQIGGIHRSFKTVARILDRMEEIEADWPQHLDEFESDAGNGFYAFPEGCDCEDEDCSPHYGLNTQRIPVFEKIHFNFLKRLHHYFFDLNSPIEPLLKASCRKIDGNRNGRQLAALMEWAPKKLLLGCKKCGDCGIQHLAFLCPESKCPKHIRNGACGGSRNGRCEVYPDRKCVWYRVYQRWASIKRIDEMVSGCVPPRIWELDNTPSWLNFHLKRDHQGASNRITQFCLTRTCRLPKKLY